MTKLLTPMHPVLMSANTFFSPRISSGQLPGRICYAPDRIGSSDEFVSTGDHPTAPPESTDGPTSIIARTAQQQSAPSWNLRIYQEPMIFDLVNDVEGNASPWLGIASPMQTGKSFLAGPIIYELGGKFGPRAQFIVLSSAEVITDQIISDLFGGFREFEVGRYDGTTKDIRPITVASIHSMARNLRDFPTDRTTFLINDEAFFTQAPSVQRIYCYFGLGEMTYEGSRHVMIPRVGDGFVIGLSGTGAGLEGYHISAELDLLTCIEQGWVRDMLGDRITPKVDTEARTSVGRERMIWWKATQHNAVQLAHTFHEHFYDKTRGAYKKVLVFVPTIDHGELLQEAMSRHYPKLDHFFVHSRGTTSDDLETSVDALHMRGGALIAVRKIARGFRGTGIDAVFHTYQTTSQELFAQRTGRAWGQTEAASLPPLHVLEVAWDASQSFANLARLLGLVDFPIRRFSTRGLRATVQRVSRQRAAEEEAEREINLGNVSPLFKNVPLLQEWRGTVGRIIKAAGGIHNLSAATELPQDVLAGYALGALPTSKASLIALKRYLGGEDRAVGLWERSWETIVDEIMAGERTNYGAVGKALIAWRTETTPGKADRLVALLQGHFHDKQGGKLEYGGIEGLAEEVRSLLPAEILSGGISDAEIRDAITSEAADFMRALPPWKSHIFEKRYLTETPTPYATIQAQIEGMDAHADMTRIMIARTGYHLKATFLRRLRKSWRIYRNAEAALRAPIETFGLSTDDRHALTSAGIAIIADLTERSAEDLLSLGMSRSGVDTIQRTLYPFDIHLKPDISAKLNICLADTSLSLAAVKHLFDAGIVYLGDLAGKTNDQLGGMRLAPHQQEEIHTLLASMGLSELSKTAWEHPALSAAYGLSSLMDTLISELKCPLSEETLRQLLDRQASIMSSGGDFALTTAILNEIVLSGRPKTHKAVAESLDRSPKQVTYWAKKLRKKIIDRVCFHARRAYDATVLESPIERIGFSSEITNVLKGAGINTMRDLTREGSGALFDIDGFTKAFLAELRAILGAFQLNSTDVLRDFKPVLDLHIATIEMSVRLSNVLHNAGIVYIGQLVQQREQDLLNVRHLGRKCLRELKEMLADMGLQLGMMIDWTPPEEPGDTMTGE